LAAARHSPNPSGDQAGKWQLSYWKTYENMLQALLSEFVTSDPNTSQYSMLFWFNAIQPSSTIINHQSFISFGLYKIPSHSAIPSHQQPSISWHFATSC